MALATAVGLEAIAGALLTFGTDAALRSEMIARTGAQVALRLETLLSTLTNAETSERGYLLTGEDRYLVPYWAARNALWREFDATEALLRNALGTVSGGFEHLRALAAAKMIVITDIVVRHRSGDPAGALDLVRSDRGQVLMEAIRVEANGLADIAAAAVAEAGQRALNAAHVAGLGGLGLLVAGLLASGAAARIRRDALRSLTDSEARLRLVQQVGRIA
jgi:CHASE3 domain sensor protein